jgi:hypothetical protein
MIRQTNEFMRFSDAFRRPLIPLLLERAYMQECKIKAGHKRIDPFVMFKASTTIWLERLVASKATQKSRLRNTKASP